MVQKFLQLCLTCQSKGVFYGRLLKKGSSGGTLSAFSTLSQVSSNAFSNGGAYFINNGYVYIFGAGFTSENSERTQLLPEGQIGTPETISRGAIRTNAAAFTHLGYNYLVGGVGTVTTYGTVYVSSTKNATSSDQTYYNNLVSTPISIENESILGSISPFEKFGTGMIFKTN